MKKLFAIVLVFSLMLTLSGCAWVKKTTDDVKEPIESEMSEMTDMTESANEPASSTTSDVKIDRDRAVDITLEHAKLEKSEVSALEVDYDKEMGKNEWDVEFHHEAHEYSYEIDADSGEILKSEKELID